MGTPDSEFETAVICYCKYSPVQAELKPVLHMESPQAVKMVSGEG
jgi:hypothetical protein